MTAGTTLMTYALWKLAPGSYDILLGGRVVGSLVRAYQGKRGTRWVAELLTTNPHAPKPAPFTQIEHAFTSMGEACDWLQVTEIED